MCCDSLLEAFIAVMVIPFIVHDKGPLYTVRISALKSYCMMLCMLLCMTLCMT